MATNIGVYYGGIAFFTSLVHNVFLLYHVQMFVSVYKIQKYSFWIAEIVFLFWNSVNDPLFGWISDKGLLNTSSSIDIVDRRLSALQKAVPLLAGSFLLFWFEWPIWTGAQLMFCLCTYDSFLTVVDLQHSSLLADLEVSSEKRTKLNTYSAIGSAAGSVSVFLSHIFWSDLKSFRIFCLFIAVISLLGSSWCVTEFRRNRNLLWVKVLFAILMFFFVGPNGSYVIIGIFIATNRMFTEGTCKLLGLIISDLVDEDTVIQNRKQPVSALVYGTAALLAKPGQTLAPLIGLSLLGFLTGNDIFSQVDNHSLKLDATLLPQALHDAFKDAAFKLLVLVPILCGGIQLLVWKNFNLHTSRLKWVKSLRHNSTYTVV
ncbi:DgyrCDS1958 [Dimorphilus gyrociliatus]|uniref:DgyrCDS1958 n=1 Tax=Dimorphilus gyrociliatus TaxID=2664684 RepID=A0A7I8VA70_9ANNE|nr:DgyrCDS1958 [Dimorphilus gyrociliatus]